ncbi:exonuclease SbcCD subunit D [Oceanobacillus kimchii]|uniref:Nuclease SbcCD subunit D n=1 Tax=Oceanobacillus kimchii TaxID=746691 RepID=A0ABQ5TLJ1_9BACI|nr:MULTISPECIES: exonuclease SbcCD subunit D [Oceanobacillus]MCT1575506.1 exonuclease SbcCD subunit D [Oceanobacillus kimchii]MCT2137137.1 exonuclease SbcCD subunit D [Oceanobacillus kimchii]OEH55323.1 exonuclease sbcCD subunit D [Oceanobacillus sp. E9]GLO66915.1 nuclease SbcCD subunit D [Oceanobacillus kimchii]
MKIFHTADWHLGKLVQGIYMTEDQNYILNQFVAEVEKEQPDVVIIAGDLYDRAVPPVDAVHLLDKTLDKIIHGLNIPVLAIAGNHDSPGRLHFGSGLMKENGYHVTGKLSTELEPVILKDSFGEVHFHFIPYTDPSTVRTIFKNDEIITHDDAAKYIINKIRENMAPHARHVAIGHAFVTPFGEERENTSDSERPLSIGGAEYVDAHHFKIFDYTALGHLHQAHYVLDEKIRYSGSPLKYSISEENHKKGFLIVELAENGEVCVEKRHLYPLRDMRRVKMTIEQIFNENRSDDYVFVQLMDQTPVLSPMEKVRSIYPNAMHVERAQVSPISLKDEDSIPKTKMNEMELFHAFYKEVKGEGPSEEAIEIIKTIMDELNKEEHKEVKAK